jgi:hypothetical protein
LVKRFRIPEVFAYVNKHILSRHPNYYEDKGIRKFGYWLKDTKTKEHQELDEFMMEGQAKSLIRLFDKASVPTSLFVIFTPGGIDFVGGYSYYHFLKTAIAEESSSLIQKQMGKLTLDEQSGEGIHEKLFTRKELKTPAYWKQVVSYF